MQKNKLPTIYSYGDYASDNYGAHCMAVEIPPSRQNKHGLTMYYSYNTLVAFSGYVSESRRGLFVMRNYWGSTTGKHLNTLDGGDKASRLDEAQFEKLFKKALKNA